MSDKRKVGSRLVKSREVNHSEQALTKLDSSGSEKAKRNANHVEITTSNSVPAHYFALLLTLYHGNKMLK